MARGTRSDDIAAKKGEAFAKVESGELIIHSSAINQRPQGAPAWCNLLFAQDGGSIGVEIVTGGEVGGDSYRIIDGAIQCPNFIDRLGSSVTDGLRYNCGYDAEDDMFIINLCELNDFTTKSDAVAAVGEKYSLDTSSQSYLNTPQLMQIFNCDCRWGLIQQLRESDIQDSDYTVSVNIDVNKRAVIDLLENGPEPREHE